MIISHWEGLSGIRHRCLVYKWPENSGRQLTVVSLEDLLLTESTASVSGESCSSLSFSSNWILHPEPHLQLRMLLQKYNAVRGFLMRVPDREVVHVEDYAEFIMSKGREGASCWWRNSHLLNSKFRQSRQQRTVNTGLNNDASQQTQLLMSHHLPSHRHEHCLYDDQQTPSTNSSRTNWTSPLSPSSGDIKSDLFDTRIGSNRSCRELTHQVPI
ncbi:uncharacterized protein [Panulirus ornatus]|uniref:uncharacterized protein n=1 Tax=Panulirus ornatus TaxID=150431 RepID=UPI003A869FE3